DAGTTPPGRSWSSYACENRASWNGADGWVETCAWALTLGLLLRICCSGQTKSIKELEPFTLLQHWSQTEMGRGPMIAGQRGCDVTISAAKAGSLRCLASTRCQPKPLKRGGTEEGMDRLPPPASVVLVSNEGSSCHGVSKATRKLSEGNQRSIERKKDQPTLRSLRSSVFQRFWLPHFTLPPPTTKRTTALAGLIANCFLTCTNSATFTNLLLDENSPESYAERNFLRKIFFARPSKRGMFM